MNTLQNGVKRKKSSFSAFLIYCFITCAVYMLPYTKFIIPYVLAALLMLSSLVLFVFLKPTCLKEIIVLGISSILVMLFSVMFSSWELTEAINEAIRNIRFFIPAIWGCYALRYTTNKQQKVFVIFFLLIVLFIFVKTTIALETDPWISRILAQGRETSSAEINQYRLENIGGFEFSYMIGTLTICFAHGAFKFNHIALKIVCIVAVAFCFNYIIQTMYTTLLILTFFAVVVIVFLNIKSKMLRILLVILSLLILFTLADFVKILSTLFESDSLLKTKFESIYNALTEGDMNELGNRPKYILQAIFRWSENPIFGKVVASSIHNHSMIVSSLETTGLFGFTALLYVWYIFTKRVYMTIKQQEMSVDLFLVCIAYMFVLAIVNPIGYVFEITMTTFLFVPLWINLFYESKHSLKEGQ